MAHTWTPERREKASQAAKERQEAIRLKIATGRAENAFQVTDEERAMIVKMRATNDQIREPGTGRDQAKVLLDKLDHENYGWAKFDRTHEGPHDLASALAEPSLIHPGQRFWTPITDNLIQGYLGDPKWVLLRCDIKDRREKTKREEQQANTRVTQGAATEVVDEGILNATRTIDKSAVTKEGLIDRRYPLTGKDVIGLTAADYREMNAEEAAAK